MNLNEVEADFLEMLNKLREMKASPWPFLCAAAMLEYLAKMSEGGDHKAYKRFVRNYLPPEYSTFTFADGKSNLPEQIYHVLRCGLVHSFSLTPDKGAEASGDGRDESILIAYTGLHLEKYPPKIDSPLFTPSHHRDAVWLVFPDFCDDIEAALRKVFSDAQGDAELRAKIEQHLTKNPPVRRLDVSAKAPTASGSVHLRAP